MQNNAFNFQIKNGTIEDAVKISKQLPEFHNPHQKTVYEERLGGKKHLVLIAYDEEKPIGFKVGYERDDTFYSWMGGVLPNYRKSGVARNLATTQEDWARKNGFQTITFKTRNRLKGMLIFALKNNFNIINVEPREPIGEYRILLRKNL